MNRLNEITFNASLMSEMRAIAFVLKLLDELPGDLPVIRDLKRMRIHMIEDEPAMESLGVASKLNTDLDFLLHLKKIGRRPPSGGSRRISTRSASGLRSISGRNSSDRVSVGLAPSTRHYLSVLGSD